MARGDSRARAAPAPPADQGQQPRPQPPEHEGGRLRVVPDRDVRPDDPVPHAAGPDVRSPWNLPKSNRLDTQQMACPSRRQIVWMREQGLSMSEITHPSGR
jgi:hypothetical protein